MQVPRDEAIGLFLERPQQQGRRATALIVAPGDDDEVRVGHPLHVRNGIRDRQGPDDVGSNGITAQVNGGRFRTDGDTAIWSDRMAREAADHVRMPDASGAGHEDGRFDLARRSQLGDVEPHARVRSDGINGHPDEIDGPNAGILQRKHLAQDVRQSADDIEADVGNSGRRPDQAGTPCHVPNRSRAAARSPASSISIQLKAGTGEMPNRTPPSIICWNASS